jgi:hypothetical protein
MLTERRSQAQAEPDFRAGSFSLRFYCSGEAGKINDLITTGTDPED